MGHAQEPAATTESASGDDEVELVAITYCCGQVRGAHGCWHACAAGMLWLPAVLIKPQMQLSLNRLADFMWGLFTSTCQAGFLGR
jgi:hypothetical protein